MIVNIQQENDGKFVFPSLQLEDNAEWVIRIVNFVAVLRKPLKVDSICTITTNIVRRTTGNPKQILTYLALPEETSVINYVPAHAVQYIIKFHDLESSFIKFFVGEQTQEIFTEAAIQCEITRNF